MSKITIIHPGETKLYDVVCGFEHLSAHMDDESNGRGLVVSHVLGKKRYHRIYTFWRSGLVGGPDLPTLRNRLAENDHITYRHLQLWRWPENKVRLLNGLTFPDLLKVWWMNKDMKLSFAYKLNPC